MSTETPSALDVVPRHHHARGWWRDAVIYQIYIRSFADGDGDGVGDLSGIASRLPYLRDLGIDAIWITPFYPSPMADGGYDVADYRDIDPLFGKLADAQALIARAHELGLRLLVDLVPNHTSFRHVWFQAALEAAPGSPERRRYVFQDGRGPDGAQPPTDWASVFGGTAWTRVPDGQWYLHLFAPEQPDLNWDNREVHEEFLSVLAFWLDRGVDGFRIDVAHGLVKDQAFPDLGISAENRLLGADVHPNHAHWDRDAVHEVYREWRALLDTYGEDRIGVAEAWVSPPERMAMYVRPDELHQAFNFDYLKADWSATALREVITSSLMATAEVDATTTWVLSNHDVQRHVTRYGDGELGRRRARTAALLTMSLPGSAYVYQGEELGLPEVTDLPESVLADPTWLRSGHTVRGRDGCRVPIPWTVDGPSYGFGAGGSWLPQPAAWSGLSVQAQSADPTSMLALYRRALAIRRDDPALRGDGLRWLAGPAETLMYERGRGLVCAVNLGAEPVALPPHDEMLLSSGPLTEDGRLPVDTAVWIRTN